MTARSSPFQDVRPAVVVAALYAVACVVWVVAGASLPGGRWLAVHLFTLGVLSNLVLALTAHFAATLLHQPDDGSVARRMALFNLGALAVFVGAPSGQSWLVAVGATIASAAVLWLYVRLRRLRKAAVTQRFGFVARTYERAAGAFLHGAVLGALLGAGVLPGTWAGAGRTAHLHINLLGWGGLTLLSTLVVFGPTVLRAPMRPGAGEAAARWLPRAATGLTVGVLALLATGAGGTVGVAARLLGAAGLAVFAAGVVAVCVPVVQTAFAAKRRSANGLLLAGACVWFPLVIVADVVVVASGRWRFVNALGVGLLVGVLIQAIVASAGYLAPMLFAGGDARNRMRLRLERAAWVRVGLFNAGVAVLAAGVVAGGGQLAAAGWILILVGVLAGPVLALVPMAKKRDDVVVP